MNPTTICFYNASEILPNKGGIERVTSLLADFLEKHGHRVLFLAKTRRYPDCSLPENQHFLPLRQREKFPDFLKTHDVKILINQDGPVPFPYPHPPREVIFIAALHFSPVYYSSDAPFQKFSELPLVRSLPEMLRKIVFKNPLLLPLFLKILKLRLGKIYRKIVSDCDRFVLLSDTYKNELRKLMHLKTLPHNICAITNPATFSPKTASVKHKKHKELLWCGRVVFSPKRPDLILQTWAKLHTKFPDWSLRIVGDGDYLPELKRLAKTLGVERVSFEGFCDPAPFYRDAAIFCMTSAHEGFGMVLVEAAAFGCVPVAFDSFAAVRDIIIDGETGKLVPSFDLDAYAKTLAHLMHNDAARECLAKKAVLHSADFSLEKTGVRWLSLFEEISQEKSATT